MDEPQRNNDRRWDLRENTRLSSQRKTIDIQSKENMDRNKIVTGNSIEKFEEYNEEFS